MEEVKEPQLERHGRATGRSALWFLLVGLIIAIPGVVLVIVHVTGLGAALIGIGCVPGAIGAGLLATSAVSRWSARHKTFA